MSLLFLWYLYVPPIDPGFLHDFENSESNSYIYINFNLIYYRKEREGISAIGFLVNIHKNSH